MRLRCRVCHVISGIDIDNGGPPVALAGLAAAQVRAGLEVTILSTWRFAQSHEVAADLRSKGIRVQLIGPATEPMSRHPGIVPAAEALAGECDVFHIHSMWEAIQHRTCRVLQRAGKPYVYRPAGMLDPWNMSKSRLRKRLYLALRARRNLNRAAAIHFTTAIERDWVARLGLTPPALVEPLGMNFAEYEQLPAAGTFRNQHPRLAGRRMVLFLGRIHRGKGLEVLIPAMGKLKDRDVCLVIAGPDGNFRAEADELIHQHGLGDRVIFTGLVMGGQKLAVLADADLLALPSYHENFGLVVVEALAAGTPVIVSDQVGLYPEIQAAGVGAAVGLDVTALAECLDRWLADEVLRSAAANKARPWVRERFNWDIIAAHWGRHYDQIAGRTSTAGIASSPA